MQLIRGLTTRKIAYDAQKRWHYIIIRKYALSHNDFGESSWYDPHRVESCYVYRKRQIIFSNGTSLSSIHAWWWEKDMDMHIHRRSTWSREQPALRRRPSLWIPLDRTKLSLQRVSAMFGDSASAHGYQWILLSPIWLSQPEMDDQNFRFLFRVIYSKITYIFSIKLIFSFLFRS